MYLFLGLLVLILISIKFIIIPQVKQKEPNSKISRSINSEIESLLRANGFKMISRDKFKENVEDFFQVNSRTFYINNPLFTALKDDEKYIVVADNTLKDDNLVDLIKISLSEYSSVESMGAAGKIALILYNFRYLFYLIAAYFSIANAGLFSIIMLAIIPSAIRLLLGALSVRGNVDKLFNKNNAFFYIVVRLIDAILYPLIFIVLYGFKAKFFSQVIIMLILIMSIRELSLRVFKLRQFGINYIYTFF